MGFIREAIYSNNFNIRLEPNLFFGHRKNDIIFPIGSAAMGKMDGKSGVAGTSFPKRRKGMNPNWLEILGFPISQPL